MIDGKCIKSCSILAVQCNKKSIKTIESIGKENNLSNVQKAFNRKSWFTMWLLYQDLL